jgi:hypothetical protein
VGTPRPLSLPNLFLKRWGTLQVDLEEEEPKEKVSMDMVESGTSKEETGKRSMPQGESISRAFSSKKHIFDKAHGEIYPSKEDLAKQYVVKEAWP